MRRSGRLSGHLLFSAALGSLCTSYKLDTSAGSPLKPGVAVGRICVVPGKVVIAFPRPFVSAVQQLQPSARFVVLMYMALYVIRRTTGICVYLLAARGGRCPQNASDVPSAISLVSNEQYGTIQDQPCEPAPFVPLHVPSAPSTAPCPSQELQTATHDD